MDRLSKVEIDGQQYYVAEGDTLLDEDQFMVYAFNREKAEEARQAGLTAEAAGLGTVSLAQPQQAALLGILQGGQLVRWMPGVVLSYRVVRNTFTSQARYELVVGHMAEAAQAWAQTCGVEFQHRADLDKAPGVGPAGALMAVREFHEGRFIAAAFFPNDPADRRRILINPSFFAEDLSYDRTGVLRHELGHVLGFRHEHIRSGAPPACPDEDQFDTLDLTAFDPQSVMHYFCGGMGSRDLKISEVDKQGAQQVYGLPLDRYFMVDV
ncbi:MAG: hypothetical protein ACRD0K_14350 [Egibacteraceae bacterium]